jgi:hypothetical protein
MKTILLSFVMMIFICEVSEAQITFQKIYGGMNYEVGNSVQQTSDGGYIIAGCTNSFGAGNNDVYLIKTDFNGDSLWTKTFGGTFSDEGNSVQQTSDGGYIIAGFTQSFSMGSSDAYLIKTNPIGNVMWTKTFGGTGEDKGYSVQQTTDGGYIILGTSNSFNGSNDLYLIRTNSNGDSLWTKTFGGTGNDEGISVQQTTDGGYIMLGTTSFGAGSDDIYLIKTDSIGNFVWSKAYGGASNDISRSFQQTTDGGYIITGITYSFGAGNVDIYLIKTNVSGDTIWTKTYGGTNFDQANSVYQTSDGNFLIIGITHQFATSDDVYLIKTNSSGDTLWTKCFGGTNSEVGVFAQQTTDGGYIITGVTNSFSIGSNDIYLIKTDSLGNSGCNESATATTVTSPPTQVTTPATIVGSTNTIVTSPPTIIGSGGSITTLCTTVGIPSEIQNPKSEISLFPNPFSFSSTLTVSDNISLVDLMLSVFNIDGRMVRQTVITFHESVIERNGMAAGIDFYKITSGSAAKAFGKLIIL